MATATQETCTCKKIENTDDILRICDLCYDQWLKNQQEATERALAGKCMGCGKIDGVDFCLNCISKLGYGDIAQ